AAELVAFDTEPTGLDYMRAEIVGVSCCIEPGVAAYVPLAHAYPGVPQQLDRARVLEALQPILEDPERGKLGHNLKFDAHVLANAGIALAGMRFDSMLESYVWNSVATNHDMDSDAQRRVRAPAPGAAARGPPGAGPRIHHRVAAAAAADSFRATAAAGSPQDPDRSALDRRRRAGGARRELRAAPDRARVPRARQAQIHLHRQAPRAGVRAHRAHPHLVRSGGGGHGT